MKHAELRATHALASSPSPLYDEHSISSRGAEILDGICPRPRVSSARERGRGEGTWWNVACRLLGQGAKRAPSPYPLPRGEDARERAEIDLRLRYTVGLRAKPALGARCVSGSPSSLWGLALLLTLSACGGDGGGGGGGAESDSPPLASARTLAYVVTQCRDHAPRLSFHQELRIRQGDRAAVTVAAADYNIVQEPPPVPGLCGLFGTSRVGTNSLFAGPFERLGVSPDGSAVVFEKTTHFSIGRLPPLAPDQEGFFFVHADGSGLRRLGPASRESLTRIELDASLPTGLRLSADVAPLSFSADGRTVVFSDRGPGPAGEDAAQAVTLDVATGARFQVTHLPRAMPLSPIALDVTVVRFLPDGTIIFTPRANLDGLHPSGAVYTVRPDGTDLKLVPIPVVLPGSSIDLSTFQITGDKPTAININLSDGIPEVFLVDRGNLLQLTNFHRFDTLRGTTDVDGQRVFFLASADPFDSNPSANCQIFSISTLGTDLQELTDFSQGEHSALACTDASGEQTGGPPPGCIIEAPRQDPVTGVLVFPSSCDPFGTNPNGEQIFAMYRDGTGLQQLTDTRRFTTEADGTVDVELPGPFASTAVRR